MAKFVDTTCAACLARQKPVSTSAKPACMKITSTAPMTIHSRLRLISPWVELVDAGRQLLAPVAAVEPTPIAAVADHSSTRSATAVAGRARSDRSHMSSSNEVGNARR